MTFDGIIGRRGITEIMHFTTNCGLLGILDSSACKPRLRLNDNQRLEFILHLNTPRVMDQEWGDYLNLSISRLNQNLFDISSIQWHPSACWRILCFDVEILKHEGVVFVTTNNIYPSAQRGNGPDALEALFAPLIYGRYRAQIRRTVDMPLFFTTCEQAEVLYPEGLSTDYLRRIYVLNGDDQDDVSAQLSITRHDHVPVIIDPSKFGDT